jgi:spore coat polysaccharide biosynthesis protein SpsF
MKTVALIQARMSSSRLPGKVLQDIAGKPMLLHVVHRAQKVQSIDSVAVITTTYAEDDAIEKLCKENGIPFFRGSLDDVLDRYYQAAIYFKADIVVRLTADCPLLDPAVIEQVVKTFHQNSFNYVANVVEVTYPDGLDTEVFGFGTLERAWKEARLKSEREHVTVYILKHPELFRLGSVKQEKDLSSLRWTVDTPQDLEFVRSIYNFIKDEEFGMEEIVKLLKEHPELSELNAGQQRNEAYQKQLQEEIEAQSNSR